MIQQNILIKIGIVYLMMKCDILLLFFINIPFFSLSKIKKDLIWISGYNISLLSHNLLDELIIFFLCIFFQIEKTIKWMLKFGKTK